MDPVFLQFKKPVARRPQSDADVARKEATLRQRRDALNKAPERYEWTEQEEDDGVPWRKVNNSSDSEVVPMTDIDEDDDL